MLSSFCAGRPTSLVIDFGARETRVMPVVDGFVLRNAVVKTSRGGDWLDNIVLGHISATHDPIKLWFEKQNPFEVTTSFRKIHTLDIVRARNHH
jgi:actin-related protein